MAIVTLTSDMGWKDHYLAAVKGAMATQLPNVQVMDISHDINAFHLLQAAFVLRNSFHHYPNGTIHVIGVHPERVEKSPLFQGSGVSHLLVKYKEHYFIGADNGIFSLLFDEKPDFIIAINNNDAPDTFPMLNEFIPLVKRLVNGEAPESMGEKIQSVREAMNFSPVVDADKIRGRVIFIDSYGNAITNVALKLFKEVGKGRSFIIHLAKPKHDMTVISKAFSEVSEGEALAIFTNTGNLMIAINRGTENNGGGADKLLGLVVNDVVQVEFD